MITNLAVPTAVPLITAAGTHKLCGLLIASLAVRNFVATIRAIVCTIATIAGLAFIYDQAVVAIFLFFIFLKREQFQVICANQ